MKKSSLIATLIIIIVLLGLGIILFVMQTQNQDGDNQLNVPPPEPFEVPPQQQSGQIHNIAVTDSGFTPKTLTINQGDTVVWTNQISQRGWPASAIHPSHRVYPDSNIAKCGTAEQNTIFDACTGLRQGETFTFTFLEKGTWNYHDHLNPSKTGTIIVQ